jgi:hypothetical protein
VRRLLPLFGVVAVLAAGCGSSSSPTPEQFAAKLKATCDEFSKRAESIHTPQGDPTAEDAPRLLVARFARTLQEVSTLFGEEVDRLRQLDPPASEAAQWHQFLRLFAEAEAGLNRGVRAARRGDQAGMVRAFADLDDLGAKIDATPFKCG